MPRELKRWLWWVRCAACGATDYLEPRSLTDTDRPRCPCGGPWVVLSKRGKRAPDTLDFGR